MHSMLQTRSDLIKRIVILATVITLANLADTIHKSSRVYLFQRALCQDYYRRAEMSKLRPTAWVDESACKINQIQARLSMFDGLDSCFSYLPPLLQLGMHAELLASVGLRRLVALNLFCSSLGVAYSVAMFWLDRSWTAHAALLSFGTDLVGGGSIVRTTIIVKCIADIAPPEILTKSYNYISGFYFVASVGGSSIGSALLSHHVYTLNSLSIACYAIAFAVALSIPKACGLPSPMNESGISAPPAREDEEHHSTLLRHASPSTFNCPRDPSKKTSLIPLLLDAWSKSYHSLQNISSAPPHLLKTLLVFVLNSLATRTEVLMPQYTSLLFAWPLARVNLIMALKSLLSGLILFTLPFFRKVYLEPRWNPQQIDLLITQASLIANTTGMIGIGMSIQPSPYFFVTALCIYTSGTGLADSLTAYGTITLPPEEKVADFYVRTGLINALTGLVGGPLWSTLLSLIVSHGNGAETAGFFPLGLPFWLGSGLFGAGAVVVATLQRG